MKSVLLVCQRPLRVPILTVFAAATQIGNDKNAPAIKP